MLEITRNLNETGASGVKIVLWAADGASVKEQSGMLVTLDMAQNVPMGWLKANSVEHVPHGRDARKTHPPVGR